MTGRKLPRIYLSPPHIGSAERGFVAEAFDSNWVAPLGPNVEAFEEEFAEYTDSSNAVALSSGTAGLHLALLLAGVERGDVVLGSDLTFVASANAALYAGAEPVFIDSERESWNLDPALLFAPEEEIRRRVNDMIAMTGGKGHIANLGHGLIPETPVSGIAAFVDAVTKWRAN